MISSDNLLREAKSCMYIIQTLFRVGAFIKSMLEDSTRSLQTDRSDPSASF